MTNEISSQVQLDDDLVLFEGLQKREDYQNNPFKKDAIKTK